MRFTTSEKQRGGNDHRTRLELRRWRLKHVDPGYDPDRVLSVSLELPESRYPFPGRWPIREWPVVVNFCDGLLEQVRALPGAESAAKAIYGPSRRGWTTRVTVEGRPTPPSGEQDEALYRTADPDYFRTLRVPLRRGRHFERADDPAHPLVAIVNEAFVKRHFPNEDPLGRQIRLYGLPRQIVGSSPT